LHFVKNTDHQRPARLLRTKNEMLRIRSYLNNMTNGNHAMKKNEEGYGNESMRSSRSTRSTRPRAAVWIGIAAGLAALAWASAKPAVRHTRRHADRGQERRNPLHFFLAGSYPGRRRIDRSGTRPLFERRQAVYDSY
jgi:hypothetical protein